VGLNFNPNSQQLLLLQHIMPVKNTELNQEKNTAKLNAHFNVFIGEGVGLCEAI